jgi:hypothetical protein
MGLLEEPLMTPPGEPFAGAAFFFGPYLTST